MKLVAEIFILKNLYEPYDLISCVLHFDSVLQSGKKKRTAEDKMEDMQLGTGYMRGLWD